MDPGAMAMKGCTAFHKAPASLERHHQIVYYHIQDTRWRGGAVGILYRLSRLGKEISLKCFRLLEYVHGYVIKSIFVVVVVFFIIFSYSLEFFTSVLTDGLSLEFE